MHVLVDMHVCIQPLGNECVYIEISNIYRNGKSILMQVFIIVVVTTFRRRGVMTLYDSIEISWTPMFFLLTKSLLPFVVTKVNDKEPRSLYRLDYIWNHVYLNIVSVVKYARMVIFVVRFKLLAIIQLKIELRNKCYFTWQYQSQLLK